MMKSHKLIIIGIFVLTNIFVLSCSKESEWLNAKSDKRSVIPESLKDFQALLDNTPQMNHNYSTAGLAGSDNFYVTDADFKGLLETVRNVYLWNERIWPEESSPSWNHPFRVVELANIVLEGLQNIPSSSPEYNNIKGQALFHRAFAYYNLAMLFCKTYDENTAQTDLGLPIRTTSDVNIIHQRSSLAETFEQMIADALEAANLLPDYQPVHQRPINAAAFALLAKIYLNMGNYELAEEYSSACLSIKNKLLDLDANEIISLDYTYRFPRYAAEIPEILFYGETNGHTFNPIAPTASNRGNVAEELLTSYSDSDLRKLYFYIASDDTHKFRGSYTGGFYNFCGLATNEVYLIRAESRARLNKEQLALEDLNTLLSHRYIKNTFVPLTIDNTPDVLEKVLEERRKELPFTANIRWEDLKRLNKEARFQKTITRTIDGVTYELRPSDKRYVLPIPDNEIELSGLTQNER